MPAFRWDFHGEGVLEEVAKQTAEVREDFAKLMDRLTRNPRNQRVGVKPVMTTPGGFTAPFDDALLVYEVFADYPRIHLLLVVWTQST